MAFLLYGANGYTGRLIAERAFRAGVRPDSRGPPQRGDCADRRAVWVRVARVFARVAGANRAGSRWYWRRPSRRGTIFGDERADARRLHHGASALPRHHRRDQRVRAVLCATRTRRGRRSGRSPRRWLRRRSVRLPCGDTRRGGAGCAIVGARVCERREAWCADQSRHGEDDARRFGGRRRRSA